MPAYNFKKQFAPAVESGVKSQTIRNVRKNPTKEGDILMLYTGQRTKACRLLRTASCRSVHSFRIDRDGNAFLADALLDADDLQDVAQADGFMNAKEFIEFFRLQYGLPFENAEIIYWD